MIWFSTPALIAGFSASNLQIGWARGRPAGEFLVADSSDVVSRHNDPRDTARGGRPRVAVAMAPARDGAGDVPIAMVNAAARHVKKGLFSLPFRKTTRAMQKLRPKRMDSAGKPGSPGYEPRATPAMPLSQVSLF